MRALITGITGQDGTYLASLLLDKGWQVYGLQRHSSIDTTWRLRDLGILDRVVLIPGDITDPVSLREALFRSAPDHVYNLAALAFVGSSWTMPTAMANVTGLGALNVFETVRQLNPYARVYQASSSEMYGDRTDKPKTIDRFTPFNPSSPYGVAKLFAHEMARVYRESYGMHISCGILFNHESPLRGEGFVTRKITMAVARIKNGLQSELKLGNLAARRDWGFAWDYVHVMHAMLEQERPADMIIGTGVSHSVEDFCRIAFETVGLDYHDYVREDESLKRPNDIPALCADNPWRVKKRLNIDFPSISFDEMITGMVTADLVRIHEKF